MTTKEQLRYEATADQSLELANAFIEICDGKETAAVFVALSMMIGHMAGQAKFPDFEGTMNLVREGAFDAFQKERQRLQAMRHASSEGAA